MKLRLIKGRSGAGKTDYICRLIAQQQANNQECILIVPDQSTYDMELMLMHRLQGGLIGVEVLSFPRLAQKVLRIAGGATRVFLSNEGKRMALRKIISEHKKDLQLFSQSSSRSGLAQTIGDMIMQCKQTELSAELLNKNADNIQDELLKAKMKDLAIIYAGLNEFMQDRYIDAEDQQNLLIERILQADFLKKNNIFVDGFYGHQFTKQNISVLGRLLQKCPEVNISLRLADSSDEDNLLFSSEKQVYTRLMGLASELGLEKKEILEIKLPNEKLSKSRASTQSLSFLEKNLYAYTEEKKQSVDICLLCANKPDDEVVMVSRKIDSLLRTGTKAREIVIAVGDMDQYAPILRRSLSQLPIYMDENRPLATHPVVSLTLSALKVASKGFNLENCLKIAKSGFAKITDDACEAFERYCLLYGLKYSSLENEQVFARGKDQNENLFLLAEQAHQQLMEPLLQLKTSLYHSKNAKDLCTALFDYYEKIELRASLESFCEEWELQGEHDIAAENAQVWNTILALLDQVAILLEGSMTTERFIQVLEEGFVAQEIGMIPALTDQITIGEPERIASRNHIKHLFVLGCNEGKIPKINVDRSVIDSEDIKILENAHIDIFQSKENITSYQRQYVYALLTRAEQSLFVSYSKNNPEGDALFPSTVTERISYLFPNATIEMCKRDVQKEPSESNAFSQLLYNLRKMADDGETIADLDEAYAYFSHHKHWKNQLELTNKRLFQNDLHFDADSRKLYDHGNNESVTRLETFNSCPFKHLLRYGIQPQEKKEFKIESVDVGNFYHDALDSFVKLVLEYKINWDDLTRDDCEKLLNIIIPNLSMCNEDENLLLKTASARAQNKRLKITLLHSIWAMVEQIRGGYFKPLLTEAIIGKDVPYIELKLSDGSIVKLQGKIDRIDAFKNLSGNYIRIIDYKSSNADFSFEELYHGVKLQLPLYLKSTEKLGKGAGMFYLHIQDAEVDSKISPDNYNDEWQKKYKLKGLLLMDERIIKAMDKSGDARSKLIPVSVNKDGSKKGDLLLSVQMQTLLDYAQDKAIKSAEDIRSGKSDASPLLLENNSACEWCQYHSICRFEEQRNPAFRQHSKMKLKDFFPEEDD